MCVWACVLIRLTCNSTFNQNKNFFVSETAELDWVKAQPIFANATKGVHDYYGVFTKSMIKIFFSNNMF